MMRRAVSPYLKRLGRVKLELALGVCATVVLALPFTTSRAAEEEYQCDCSDVTQTTDDVYGGIECQHGPEQDVDCYLFALLSAKPLGSACTDKGAAAPNPLPTWNQLSAAQQAQLTALGFNAGMVDGKCECFKCQVVNNQGGGPCEYHFEYFGGWCEKETEGNCELEDDTQGTIRIQYAAKLKAGKTTCSDSGNGSGDGSGSGTNVVEYCDGAAPGTGGSGNRTGANCISDDCERDLTQPQHVIAGLRKKCK